MRATTITLFGLLVLLVAATSPGAAVVQEDQSDCTFPITRTDATGTDVTVDEEPSEVVTLNPSAAQTMWEIGAEGKVVGVSEYAFYLDGAENRTNVYPSGGSVDVEQVIALQPDLVLAPNTIPNATVAQLRDAGVTVFKFDLATSIEFVYDKTELTGRLVGACESADDRVDRMRSDVDTIEEAVQGVDRPRVLYSFFGFTAGNGTFIHTIIETSGGRNVAAEAGISGYQALSEEVVVDRDPQWLLRNSDQPDPPDSEAYQNTTAVKNGNVVVVDSNLVSQPAPRIVEPMKELTKAMHPEAYERAKFGPPDDSSGGDTTPPPSFSVDVAPLNVSAVELHGTVSITATVTNAGGPGSFSARLYTDGGLRRTTTISVGPDERKTVTLRHTFSTVGNHTVRVNDESLGTVSVVRERETETLTPADDGAEDPPGDAEEPTATEITATATEATVTATESPTATEVATTADPTATTTPTEREPTETAPSTGTPGATPTGTAQEGGTDEAIAVEGGQPGFGPLAALAALLVAGVLARGRR